MSEYLGNMVTLIYFCHSKMNWPPDKSAYWKIFLFTQPKHMFQLMGKEINAILGAQNILIWTHDETQYVGWYMRSSLVFTVCHKICQGSYREV